MNKKIVNFALNFLKSNLEDPDVAETLAEVLGVDESQLGKLVDEAKEAFNGEDRS
jgi:hypothetical protein